MTSIASEACAYCGALTTTPILTASGPRRMCARCAADYTDATRYRRIIEEAWPEA